MKKINRKRLNNKGFTLIELLAVVIILAVVMGIAMTSVLSTMNKSKIGSLYDSSLVVADGFNKQNFASLIDNSRGKLFNVEGYDFTSDASGYLVNNDEFTNEFNISGNAYALNTNFAMTGTNKTYDNVTSSFVNFDVDKEKFVVCLVAKAGGNYAVSGSDAQDVTIDGNTYKIPAGTTIACSDGQKSN